MSRIIIELPLDRGSCGSLYLFGGSGQLLCGPFAVAGRANDRRAAAENNPSRNPLLRYGDTPTGSYRVKEIISAPGAAASFGPHGVIVIEAMAGDAALAEANGRYRLYIQGGDPAPNGQLRATVGALRLSNGDLAILLSLLSRDANARCDVLAHEGVAPHAAVFVDDDCDDEDPPPPPGETNVLRDLFSEVSRRDALRAGAAGTAGLTALSLSVSFVSLAASTPAHAYTQMAYNEAPPPPPPTPSGVPGTTVHGVPSQEPPPPSTPGNPFPKPPPDYQHLKNPLIDYSKNPNPNNSPEVQQGIQKNYQDNQNRQNQQNQQNQSSPSSNGGKGNNSNGGSTN